MRVHRATAVIAACVAGGCSLVFSPSSYSGGSADGGPTPDSGGNADRATTDGAADVDGAPDVDGGVPIGALPMCDDGVRGPGPNDLRGRVVALTDAFHVAIFGGGVAADGETGLVSDIQLPVLSGAVDVAVAAGPPGIAYVGVATAAGELSVYPVMLEGGLTVGPAYTVNWSPAPTSIDRLAMRWSAELVVAVVGSVAGTPTARGWNCALGAGELDCGISASPADASTLQTVAIANVDNGVIFLGTVGDTGYDFRPGLDTAVIEHPFGFQPPTRVGGTTGPIVFGRAANSNQDPWIYYLTTSGTGIHQLGTPGGPVGVAHLATVGVDSELRMVRGTQTDITSFVLEIRTAFCRYVDGCTCPDAMSTSCTAIDGYTSRAVDGYNVRFVEAERAGSATLAFVGMGVGRAAMGNGTEVSLYAFDADNAPVDVAEGIPGLLLGSGAVTPGVIGTLVTDVGVRAVAIETAAGVDVIDVALVDLVETGGETRRRAYVSAARFCRTY